MQLVLLGGELGEKYGTQHEYYNLRTPADAIKLLCVNYPEFQCDLVTAHERGVGYKVIKGLPMEDYDEINLPFGSKPLMLVPVITGSGGSTTQILLGVGLVAASFLIPGAGLLGTSFLAPASSIVGAAATASALSIAGTVAGTLGIGLILSGTAQLLSPQPEIPKLGNNRLGEGTRAQGVGPQGITRGASGEQSYLFTGPANTVGAGATVPVIYGRVIAGSHLLSSTLEIVEDSDPHLSQIGEKSRASIRINGEKVQKTFKNLGGLRTKELESDYTISTILPFREAPLNHQFKDDDGSIQQNVDDNAVASLKTDVEIGYNDKQKKKLHVVFSLEKGLFSKASGANTTQFDGLISYRIEVVMKKEGNNPTVAFANATIQGFFGNSQCGPYVYAHELDIPSINGNYLKIKVKITDAECRQKTEFRFIGVGYDLVPD